jgi:predicted secreted protein
MATSGDRAFGTTLTYSTGSKVVGEITSMTAPELTQDTIEMTSHDSTDRYREFIGGLRDGGELTISGNSVPADEGQAQILTHFDADDAQELVITFPDSSNWTFNAICTAAAPVTEATTDGKLEFSGTFKITGSPTFATS